MQTLYVNELREALRPEATDITLNPPFSLDLKQSFLNILFEKSNRSNTCLFFPQTDEKSVGIWINIRLSVS